MKKMTINLKKYKSNNQKKIEVEVDKNKQKKIKNKKIKNKKKSRNQKIRRKKWIVIHNRKFYLKN